jgi:pimeloyl-ACP methyl ester carboxylesterase
VKETIHLCGRKGNLVGILAEPTTPDPRAPRSALLLTSTRELHRTGAHRQYVHLARRIAAAGIPAHRFDFSGYGDSLDRSYDFSFPIEEKARRASQDILDVMDHLQAERGIDRFLLAGGCAGAFISLKVACRDDRVKAVGAINTPIELFTTDQALVTGLENRRRTTQLGRGSLLDPVRWQRFFRGKTSPRRIAGVLAAGLKRPSSRSRPGGEADDAPLILRILRELQARGTRSCFTFNQDELGHQYLLEVIGREVLRELSSSTEIHYFPGVDHIFIQHHTRRRFIEDLCAWMIDALHIDRKESDERPTFRASVNVLGDS